MDIRHRYWQGETTDSEKGNDNHREEISTTGHYGN